MQRKHGKSAKSLGIADVDANDDADVETAMRRFIS